MSGNGSEKGGMPEGFLYEFPEELNPELFKTSIDWEEEERIIREEEKKAGQEKIKNFFRRRQ